MFCSKMTQAAKIAEMLGGKAVLRCKVAHEVDLEQVVRAGVPAEAVRVLSARTGTKLSEIQEVASIDRSTFVRRARSHSKLRTDESDRVVRFARIAVQAIDALGQDDARGWLHEPHRALGGRAPFDLLDTGVGARQVEQIIGRIEHGVFS